MKNSLISFLKNNFNKQGFYLDKIPTVKILKQKFDGADDDEIWFELKRYSKVVSNLKDLNSYDELLNFLIPDLSYKFPNQNSVFFGSGKGKNTLNSYRKLEKNNKLYFEKVYRKDSSDYKSLLWFNNEIKPQLDLSKIKTPSINNIVEGKVITAVYFDFVNLIKLKKDSMLIQSFSITKILMSLKTTGPTKLVLDPNNSQNEMIALNFDQIYLQKAKAYLIKQNLDVNLFDEITRNVFSLNYYIAHGDLNSKNIFGDNYLIDWDSCGSYPIGFDTGKALNWLYLDNSKTMKDILDIISKNFKNHLTDLQYEQFLLGSLFFCLTLRASEVTYGKIDVDNATVNSLYEALRLQYSTCKTENFI